MYVRNVNVTLTIPNSIDAAPLLGVTASQSADGKQLSLLIVNKTMTEEETVKISVPEIKTAHAEVLSGPAIDATNEEKADTVTIKELPTEVRDGILYLTLPPHSLTGVLV